MKNNEHGVETQSGFPPVPSVNFHLWKACNMSCKFCFATFEDYPKGYLPKGHLPVSEALQVVEALAAAGFEKITFAGGEPLLCPWLDQLLARAKELGMTTMIVSNCYKLTAEWVAKNAHSIDWITMSIDSLDDATNVLSGRADRKKTPLTRSEAIERAEWIVKSGIKLKVNTVVHALNWEEDFTSFITLLHPERWKIFQVLPVAGQNSGKVESLEITGFQFQEFLNRHSDLKDVTHLVPEDNDTMTASYVMVDPAGRFFDNSKGFHTYSPPILEVGVKCALAHITLDVAKFEGRDGIYEWNNPNQVITLSGLAGSGKSSVGQQLASALNCEFVSAGSLARAEAGQRGVTIQQFQEILLEEGEDFDQYLDQEMVNWASQRKKGVMDYRMGFFHIPDAMSVFLSVSPEVAALRVAGAHRSQEFSENSSPEAIEKSLNQRNFQMAERLKTLYGADFSNSENYDLVIDTDSKTVEEVVEEIIARLDMKSS